MITRRIIQLLGLLLLWRSAAAATITIGAWTPIFKGVELANGQQIGYPEQRVLCLRVDLQDPDVELFTTPRCSSCYLETLSENTSYFLQGYGVQAAVNGSFYLGGGGITDAALGAPEDVHGYAVSRGNVVSPADDPAYVASFLFTQNKEARVVMTGRDATNAPGTYTAITGNERLVAGGTNLFSPAVNDLDPRTACGLSKDRRYLLLMTIDGRQAGWSDGADYYSTGEWLKRFGAWDAINLDGGGSTTMVRADCVGNPVRLNRSSYVASYGRERRVGHNIGVFAVPLPSPLRNLQVEPGTTTSLITWETDLPGSTQVFYGTTTNYGLSTVLDTRQLRHHVVTLNALARDTTYFYKAVSSAAGGSLTEACQFKTLSALRSTRAVEFDQVWTYTTNNLDGVAWTSPGYSDADWLGSGPGLLCVENSSYVSPRNTFLPPPYGQVIPRTYYFRTHFQFEDSPAGASLVFSNYVDDGAVFYLNGTELYRLRMAPVPAAIINSSPASSTPCVGKLQAGDAATNCPDVFTISGSLVSSLIQGDNTLAVEVHNYTTGNDIVFGSALTIQTPTVIQPTLQLQMEDDTVTLFWNGDGFTLQQSSDLGNPQGWTDVSGPVKRSPYTIPGVGRVFYRLRP